mgnify:CR=1 FL=1
MAVGTGPSLHPGPVSGRDLARPGYQGGVHQGETGTEGDDGCLINQGTTGVGPSASIAAATPAAVQTIFPRTFAVGASFGVVVVHADSGVDIDHPDLNLVAGYDFVRNPQEAGDGDGIDPDPEESVGGSDPAAVNYHGSHVAGTVAASGNNGIGVAGVAYGARVMPLRAITATGGTSYDVRQAVRFAAGLENDSGTGPERPADIINLSLGGAGFSSLDQALYEMELVGHDFYLFVDAQSGNPSVVYRRRGYQYGVIRLDV